MNGEIISQWKKQTDTLNLKISVPVNTTAHIYVPAPSLDHIRLNGKPLSISSDGKVSGHEKGYMIVAVGSGEYVFDVSR